jgi:hypothetical protein
MMANSVRLQNKQTAVATFPLWGKITFLGLALVKLWLVSGLTLFAIGNATHDDRLFLNLASDLLSGHWLGNYNNLTLAKGPFYPLWIATTFLLGIPLLLAQHLLYIAACAILIIAIRPIFSRQSIFLVIWTILLFNPMSYTDAVMTRVVREGIYTSLTILVAASAVGILARYDRPLNNLLPWSTCLGFSLSAFWLTREEGVWMIPSILVIVGFAVVRMRQTQPNRWRPLTSMCVLPFCIWLIAIGAVAGINKVQYGLFTTSEFKSHDFLAAYGALLRVKHSHWQPYYPLPKETRERIYKISPAFAELAPVLEGNVGATWASISCQDASLCDDIGGGWFVWALRDAVAAAGHYTSAASAAKYYRQLATEINAACADRQIECGAERASLIPPWRIEYTRPFLNALVRGAVLLFRFEGFQAYSSPSIGTDEEMILFRDLTISRLSLAVTRKLRITGWAFAINPASSTAFSVRAADGTLSDAAVKRLPSPDVYKHFRSDDKNFPNARKARFEITTSCADGCSLHIRTDDRSDERIPLDGSVKAKETPEFYFYIDSLNNYTENDVLPHQSKIDNFKMSILGQIGKAYQAAVPFLIVFALIGYLISAMNILRTKIVKNLWLINTALLIALVIRLLIFSMIDVTSFPCLYAYYLSSAYSLLLIFVTLALPIKFEKPH